MRTSPIAAVTASALHIPGVDLGTVIPGARSEPAVSADDAKELLGRKGLLAKEPATRLALCAVHRALDLPVKSPRPSGRPDPRTAVVASSNLGNVQTVAQIARSLNAGDDDISPLDAPNASSNIVASSVAIWFRFGGPNLMVCSGATAGLDAVIVAGLLLRSGRADRVVVVGAEPDDEFARRLHARTKEVNGHTLRAASAAVVLARPTDADPTAPRLAVAPLLADADAAARAARGRTAIAPGKVSAAADSGIDLELLVGDTYGASGVLQVALAAALVQARLAGSIVTACGDNTDGWRMAVVGDDHEVAHWWADRQLERKVMAHVPRNR